jgi:hypothetical protein
MDTLDGFLVSIWADLQYLVIIDKTGCHFVLHSGSPCPYMKSAVRASFLVWGGGNAYRGGAAFGQIAVKNRSHSLKSSVVLWDRIVACWYYCVLGTDPGSFSVSD